MRSFFAIAVGGAARDAALALLGELRAGDAAGAVRWVRPEGLHVTLRFLGEIDAARVAPLAAAVRDELAAREPFELALGAVHGFPTARRPRVVACTVAPEAPLQELAAAVERGTARAGFEPERRRFRPHLTLGRVRRGAQPVLADLPSPTPSDAARMRVDRVVLYRSELSSSGARYSPLEHLALGENLAPLSSETQNA